MADYTKPFNALGSFLKKDWDTAKGAWSAFSGNKSWAGAANAADSLWKGLGTTEKGFSTMTAGGKVAGYGLTGLAIADFINPFSFGWND